ncbi:MAG: hypothetical protein AUH91_04165 [Verrucomicrobia bacterium 13_1_40CM_4_54_4]|nr:MAG: hypothetical protein AUH91_04165 [Verrucomicrobia bacterium 13_1_40CM_4_54_4]
MSKLHRYCSQNKSDQEKSQVQSKLTPAPNFPALAVRQVVLARSTDPDNLRRHPAEECQTF